jgi:imidazolonepropionase-like amidohydrolase
VPISTARNWILFALCLVVIALPAQAETLYLKAANLVDPVEGKLRSKPLITIVDDRITEVAFGESAPEAANVIDLGDATLLPGLADMHTHLTFYTSDNGYESLAVSYTDEAVRGVVNARKTLMAGFTAARNLGAGGYSDVSLRDAINSGRVPGPRLQVSGPSLGSPCAMRSIQAGCRGPACRYPALLWESPADTATAISCPSNTACSPKAWLMAHGRRVRRSGK